MADRESIQRVYTIGHFMPRRGINPQWNDQRITDYPTAPQRHNRIITVYYGHSHLVPFHLNQGNVLFCFSLLLSSEPSLST